MGGRRNAKRRAETGRAVRKPVAPPTAIGTLEEFRTAARESTGDALGAMRSALRARNPTVKLGAAKALLEFAWGKPAMSVQHTFAEPIRHKVFHLVLTDDTGMAAADEADGEGAGGDPA